VLLLANEGDPAMTTGVTPALAIGKVPSRRVPRFKLTVPLSLSVLRSGIPDKIPGRSVEIGEGGMGVEAASRLVPGESVRVEFLLPHASSAIRATAIVRYQYNQCFGLMFLRLPVEQQSMIRYWTRCEGDVSLAAPEKKLLSADTSETDAGLEEDMPETLSLLPGTIFPETPKPSSRIWRVLRFAIPLIVVAAVLGWWRWEQEWKELEAPIAEGGVPAKAATQVAPEIMENRLVHQVTPEYPESARQAGMQGTVLLDIVVSPEGAITQVKPISGPDILSRAAIDAVRWWRYQPYLVNGQPQAVESSVTVHFKLEQ
jgi:TonB family protein